MYMKSFKINLTTLVLLCFVLISNKNFATSFATSPDWTYDGPKIFDGSTTYVDAGTNPGSAPSMTIAFKMTANKLAYMVPVDKLPSAGAAGWAIKLRNNGDIWFLLGSQINSSNSSCSVSGAYAVGTAVHITCTFSGGIAKIYINGALKVTRTGLTQTTNDIVTNLRLGIPSINATNEKFSGILENVKIYNSVLLDSEISDLANNRLPAQYTLTSISPSNYKVISGSKISWVAPISGSYNVYISDNADSISNAGISSKYFRGNVTIPEFNLSTIKINSGTKYYWRIDLVSGTTTLLGAVNTFINPLNSANYHLIRGGLRNSITKFVNQRTGRVAFLGGSITQNPGWRDSICAYLKKQFPTTTFDFINAGIGSMGSTPAAFRMERDVLSKGKIDLLFEEAAVNDGPSGNNFSKTEQIRAMEGIVRHAITSNPQMDIVFVYFADPSKNASYASNLIPDVIINHDSVARVYNIPAINLAKEVSDRIKLGEFDWNADFVSIHPSPFGQGIYYRSIRCFLDSIWKNSVLSNDQLISRNLSEKIDQYCYDTGYLVDITKAESSPNWTINSNWSPTDGIATRADYTNVPMLIGQTPDSILTFKFNGRAVGISTASGPNAGVVLSSIDGGPWQSTDLFTTSSKSVYLPWYYTLYSTLSQGNHTLRLKMSANHNVKSIGNVALIRYFFVSGTSSLTDIDIPAQNNPVNIYKLSKDILVIHVDNENPFSYRVYDSNGGLYAQKSNCLNNNILHVPLTGVILIETRFGDIRYINKVIN